MSNLQFSPDPEKMRGRKFPAWVIKTVLIGSLFPFLSLGAFMIGRILRITGGKDFKLAIPFILFVLLFCAVPVVQVFSSLRKLKKSPEGGHAVVPPVSMHGIREAADGREFFFPAARNPGTVLVISALTLFWAAAVWGLCYTRAQLFIPIMLAISGVIILLGCMCLWFKETRMTINPKGMRAANRWLIYGRTFSYDSGEIARFSAADGKRIQLITRTGEKITVATGIAGKPEADRLAAEMNKALGLNAPTPAP